jgi:DNA-binding NarL/FixJ family response regulator
VAAARIHLGEKALATVRARGRTLTPEQVLAAQDSELFPEHLPLEPAATPPQKSMVVYPSALTRRELEVLRLVAHGLTDAEVAERLVISPHTVHVHISTIYSKLEVKTRSAATRYAFEHNLV